MKKIQKYNRNVRVFIQTINDKRYYQRGIEWQYHKSEIRINLRYRPTHGGPGHHKSSYKGTTNSAPYIIQSEGLGKAAISSLLDKNSSHKKARSLDNQYAWFNPKDINKRYSRNTLIVRSCSNEKGDIFYRLMQNGQITDHTHHQGTTA